MHQRFSGFQSHAPSDTSPRRHHRRVSPFDTSLSGGTATQDACAPPPQVQRRKEDRGCDREEDRRRAGLPRTAVQS